MAQSGEIKLLKRFDQNIEITGNLIVGGTVSGFTETDPTVPSHVKSITTTNISNWDDAYGWGNHADAGYLTSFTESDTLDSVSDRGASTGNTLTLGGMLISATAPLLDFVDTNSFTDTNDRFRIRAAGNVGQVQWYDASTTTTTTLATFYPDGNLGVLGTISGDGSGLTKVFNAKEELGSSVNLNDYRTTGYMSQNSNAHAAAGTNYPVPSAGILEVITDDTGNGLHTVQRYSKYSSNQVYTRYYYNGGWQSWTRFLTTEDEGSGNGLDADTLDGNHASDFALASHTHSYLPLTGGTITGALTLTGGGSVNLLTLSGSSPTLAFTDVTSGADDFYIHVNSNNFYILRDQGGVGDYGEWDSPHPLQLEADTGNAYIYGNTAITSGNIGSQSVSYATSAGSATSAASATNADTVDGLHGSQFLRTDIDSVTSGYLRATGTYTNTTGVILGTFDGSTATSNSFTAAGIILGSGGKTGWGAGDVFGAIRFYNTDGSGIGARDAVKIVALNTTGNGTSTTTFNGELAFYTSAYNATATEKVRIDDSGRVGIGTDSPSEKIEVSGNAILDASNANLKIKAGATGTKGDIQWTFNTDSTVYASVGITYDNRATDGFLIDSGYPITLDAASGYIRFSNNGSEKMRISTNGDVGIGVTPSAKLHVTKGAVATKYVDAFSVAVIEDTEARLQLCATNGGSNASAITLSNESHHWALHHRAGSAGNYFAIGYANTTTNSDIVGSCMSGIGLTVSTSGWVGVGGITSPTTPLQVSGKGRFSEGVLVDGTDPGNPAANTDQIRVSGYGILGNRGTFYFTNPGTVQIGTGSIHNQDSAAEFTSSAITLRKTTTVLGSVTATSSIKAQSSAYIDVAADQTDSAEVKIGVSSGSTEGFVMTNNLGSNHIKDGTSIKMLTYDSSSAIVESGRFTNTGLGLGGQTAPAYPLDVTGNGRFTSNLYVGEYIYHNGDTNTSIRLLGDRIILYAGGVNMIDVIEGGTDYIDFANNTARITSGGAFETTGDIIAYTTTSLSDKNQKENINKIDSPIDKIKKINGYTFDWKHNQASSGGVIAQEVEKVLPEIVKERSIMDSEPHKTVEYNGLIGLLIEAVKELSNKVEELENKLNGTEL